MEHPLALASGRRSLLQNYFSPSKAMEFHYGALEQVLVAATFTCSSGLM